MRQPPKAAEPSAKEMSRKLRHRDLTGRVFGDLRVVGLARPIVKGQHRVWLCRCWRRLAAGGVCGNYRSVSSPHLYQIRSCVACAAASSAAHARVSRELSTCERIVTRENYRQLWREMSTEDKLAVARLINRDRYLQILPGEEPEITIPRSVIELEAVEVVYLDRLRSQEKLPGGI